MSGHSERPRSPIGTAGRRRYEYVGDPAICKAVRPGSEGRLIGSGGDFGDWAREQSPGELAEPFTYVVDEGGSLRLAPRRSEHVACAGRGRVLGAGEIAFVHRGGGWAVATVSNQSTGYCPAPESWAAVADALDRAGLTRPEGFTHEVAFRRCTGCEQVNVVRDEHFVCVFCDADLPRRWNVSA
ncbi:hypothetical protein ABZ729_11865 [Streptomyces sp. NPDC006678]|uniref:hypothetical protein n=1 Tax=Streptomyces sp. NPDC006678 TaxID=3157185 RepID=UPI0033DCE411